MITIREACLDDATAISQLMVPVAKSQISSGFPAEGKTELLSGMTPDAVAGNMQQGYRYHVALDGVRVCGVIGMRGYTHVYHLFVATDRQGQGTGRQLWERAFAASRAEVRLPEYTVYSSLIAEEFYHRLGFRRTGNAQTRSGVTAIPMRMIVSDTER